MCRATLLEVEVVVKANNGRLVRCQERWPKSLVTKNLLRSNVVARKARGGGGTRVESLFWAPSNGLPRLSRSGTGGKSDF